MRLYVVAAVAVVLGAILLVAVTASRAAPDPRCDEGMDEVACQSAVGAVVRRGLPALHPLILATRVEPGPNPGAQDLGHRATVEFDMFGMPDPIRVELHFDVGAHWGGRSDHTEQEVAAWALAPVFLAAGVAVGLLMIGWRRRRPTTD